MLFLLMIYSLLRKYGNTTSNLRVHQIYGYNTTTLQSSTLQQYARMFQKQLRQCNFIRKCKPRYSLALPAYITNANKMLITQRLWAFLAPAQLRRNFVFFSFAPFPLILLIHATHRLRFHFDEEKSYLSFLYVGRMFFPSTISILRTIEEFKLRCSICGRIKNIASSNLKSTDFMFRGCRSLFIAYVVLAFTRHVFKTYENAFIVQQF